MKKIFLTLFVLAALFAFAGCESTKIKPGKLEYETISDEGVGAQFEKPKGWYEPQASLDNETVYTFIVPNRFSQDDRVEGMLSVISTGVLEGNTLEDEYKFLEETIKELSADYEDFKIVEANKDMTIMGKPAKELTFQYQLDFDDSKKTAMVSQAVVIGDDNLYKIVFSDEQNDFETYKAVRDKLYESLKEI